MTNQQKIIISVVVGFIVLALIGYGWWSGSFERLMKYRGQEGEEKTIYTPDGELKGIEVADGSSLITEEGEVVLSSGKKAENEADPGAPSAPQQSNPTSKEALPDAVIKISATSGGFMPKNFEVRAGAPVSISLTSEDDAAYVFAFRDASLKGVAIGVGPGDPTRVISFNAPAVKGNYDFYSNIPSQANNPAFQGTMVVK